MALLEELVALYEEATRRAESSDALAGLVAPGSHVEGWDFLPRLELFDVLAFESDEDWACMVLRAPPVDESDDFDLECRFARIINFANADECWMVRSISGWMLQPAQLDAGEDIEEAFLTRAATVAREEKPPPQRSSSFVPPQRRSRAPGPSCVEPRFFSALTVRVEDQADEGSLQGAVEAVGELPPCYREFVLSYGGAEYSSVIQIRSPWDLEAYAHDKRYLRNLRQWRWDDNEHLDPQSASECVQVGFSEEFGVLLYHPVDPASLYFLPKTSRTIHHVGATVDEALEWLCSSGVIVPAFDVRYVFGRGDSYVHEAWGRSERSAGVQEVVAQLCELGLHEARHERDWPGLESVVLLCPSIGGMVDVNCRARAGRSAADVDIRFDPKSSVELRRGLASKLQQIGFDVRGDDLSASRNT